MYKLWRVGECIFILGERVKKREREGLVEREIPVNLEIKRDIQEKHSRETREKRGLDN